MKPFSVISFDYSNNCVASLEGFPAFDAASIHWLQSFQDILCHAVIVNYCFDPAETVLNINGKSIFNRCFPALRRVSGVA